MAFTDTSNNIIMMLHPPSGGVQSLYRSNYKNTTGLGIGYDIIGFGVIRDSTEVGPVQLSFVPSMDSFSTMNLTNTEIMNLVSKGKIKFIWSFDDPWWEDYTTDLEYTYRLKNANTIFNYDLNPVYHTFYRSGIYFVKLVILYENYKIELTKKVEIGRNQIGLTPQPNKVYKNDVGITFESFNSADKIYYYLELDSQSEEGVMAPEFTLSNGQVIATSDNKFKYYGYFSYSEEDGWLFHETESPGWNNVDVYVYFSHNEGYYSGWESIEVPIYEYEMQYVTFILTSVVPRSDFRLYENSPIMLDTQNKSYRSYTMYYFGYTYNYTTKTWDSLLTSIEKYREVFYTIDKRNIELTWHYTYEDTPYLSSTISGVPTTGGNFTDPFYLTLKGVNATGGNLVHWVAVYNTVGKDPYDNFEDLTYNTAIGANTPILVTDNVIFNIRVFNTSIYRYDIDEDWFPKDMIGDNYFPESKLYRLIFNKVI